MRTAEEVLKDEATEASLTPTQKQLITLAMKEYAREACEEQRENCALVVGDLINNSEYKRIQEAPSPSLK